MSRPVLVVGGSGAVGSRAVRALRQLHPDLPITIGGRDLSRASAVAAAVGGPTDARAVDLSREDLGLADAGVSAVVVLLKDDSLNTMRFAQARGIPYITFSLFLYEIAPEVALFAREPSSAPILLLGHFLGGIATLVSLHAAAQLRTVHTIEIGAVVGADDQGGPESQADFQRLADGAHRGSILRRGRWLWTNETRGIRDVTGIEREAQPLPLLDVASLAAATSAHSIRGDMAVREGSTPSTELIVEVVGEAADGTLARIRHEIVDDEVYARLSAFGAAIAVERMLGLAGGPPVTPGLYHPDNILDPAHVLARLATLGVRATATASAESRVDRTSA